MIKLSLLEDTDTILATDYVRQLDLEYVGQSDTLFTQSTYSGIPINHLRWLEVSRAGMDFWIGKSVGEFRERMLAMEKQHQPVSDYEFIRGNVPQSHVLPETEQEKYHRLYKHFRLPVGKYKGKLATFVKGCDPGYYYWAVDTGVIPHEVWQSLSKF